MSEQISEEESMKRILETPKGSIPYLYNFGSYLYLLNDRKFDDAWKVDFISYTVEAIDEFEKRVSILNVNVKSPDDIIVNYKSLKTGEVKNYEYR